MKSSIFLIIAVFVGLNSIWAQAIEPKTRPLEGMAFGGEDILSFALLKPFKEAAEETTYQVIRKYMIDVDSLLFKATGIRAHSCTFTSKNGEKISSKSGLGFCLFENFLASIGTTGMPGTISAEVEFSYAQPGVLHEIDIHWRPVEFYLPNHHWTNSLVELLQYTPDLYILLTRYFDNEIVLTPKSGVPWAELLTNPALLVVQMGLNESNPEFHQIILHFEPAAAPETSLPAEKQWTLHGDIRIMGADFLSPTAVPLYVFKVQSDWKIYDLLDGDSSRIHINGTSP